MSSDEFRPVQAEMEPKLAAYRDKLLQNGPLFRRIEAVYQNAAKLNPEQQRLTWDVYTDFVRAGAKLTDEKKKRIAEINQRLAALYDKFSNNLLHDEENYVLYLKKDQLGGLAPSFVASAAAAAKQRGHDGEYAILNTRSSVEPFLTDSTERALREKVWPLIEAKTIKPVIHQVFPLADAVRAHALMESSTHIGKIVLDTAR